MLQRWVSPDPLTVHALGADPNVYAYVSGRALMATDPLGLETDEKNGVSFSPDMSTSHGVQRNDAAGWTDTKSLEDASQQATDAYYENQRKADAAHEEARKWQEGRMKPSHLSPTDEGSRAAALSEMRINYTEGRYKDAYGRTDMKPALEDSWATARLSGGRGGGWKVGAGGTAPPARAQAKPPRGAGVKPGSQPGPRQRIKPNLKQVRRAEADAELAARHVNELNAKVAEHTQNAQNAFNSKAGPDIATAREEMARAAAIQKQIPGAVRSAEALRDRAATLRDYYERSK